MMSRCLQLLKSDLDKGRPQAPHVDRTRLNTEQRAGPSDPVVPKPARTVHDSPHQPEHISTIIQRVLADVRKVA